MFLKHYQCQTPLCDWGETHLTFSIPMLFLYTG